MQGIPESHGDSHSGGIGVEVKICSCLLQLGSCVLVCSRACVLARFHVCVLVSLYTVWLKFGDVSSMCVCRCLAQAMVGLPLQTSIPSALDAMFLASWCNARSCMALVAVGCVMHLRRLRPLSNKQVSAWWRSGRVVLLGMPRLARRRFVSDNRLRIPRQFPRGGAPWTCQRHAYEGDTPRTSSGASVLGGRWRTMRQMAPPPALGALPRGSSIAASQLGFGKMSRTSGY